MNNSYKVGLAAISLLLLQGCNTDKTVDTNHDAIVKVQTSPPDGATNVTPNTNFNVTFSQPMDSAEAQMHFMLHEGWGVGGMEMEGHFEWNVARNQMIFNPMEPLQPNMTYTMHLKGMMRGIDGWMHIPLFDSTVSGGGMMMSGRMMGGIEDDEIRIVCSTGPDIRRQLDLNLTGDVIFVADGGSGDIAAIDPATNAIIGIQPHQNIKFFHHLYLSPDRTRLVVSDPGENMSSGGSGGHGGHGGTIIGQSHILVLDSRTLLEVGRLNIEGVVHNALVTPDGQNLLFNNANHNMLHRYSFPALMPQSSYSVGIEPLEVSVTPDGEYALIANSGNNTVTRVHLKMDMPADNVTVGATPVGAWISPDGTTAWVTNEGSKSITVLTISPFAVVTTIALGFTPGQAFVNPVRPEAYVADEDNGQVVIFNSTTYARLGQITTGAGAHGIVFSPDGTKAFVTNENVRSVSVIDTGNRTVLATVQVGIRPNGIVYRRAL